MAELGSESCAGGSQEGGESKPDSEILEQIFEEKVQISSNSPTTGSKKNISFQILLYWFEEINFESNYTIFLYYRLSRENLDWKDRCTINEVVPHPNPNCWLEM